MTRENLAGCAVVTGVVAVGLVALAVVFTVAFASGWWP